MLKVLIQYYEGGQWLSDYEMDEKGVLPQNLKRGVLSQDALYDFIERIETRNGALTPVAAAELGIGSLEYELVMA